MINGFLRLKAFMEQLRLQSGGKLTKGKFKTVKIRFRPWTSPYKGFVHFYCFKITVNKNFKKPCAISIWKGRHSTGKRLRNFVQSRIGQRYSLLYGKDGVTIMCYRVIHGALHHRLFVKNNVQSQNLWRYIFDKLFFAFEAPKSLVHPRSRPLSHSSTYYFPFLQVWTDFRSPSLWISLFDVQVLARIVQS